MRKTLKDYILQFSIFLIVVFAFIFGSSYLAGILTTSEEDVKRQVEERVDEKVAEDVIPKVTEIIREKKVILSRPDCERNIEGFEYLQSIGQVLPVALNESSYGLNGKFARDIEPIVLISGNDEIACGYLYIRASKGGQPLERDYESIYVSPQGFGGHLLWTRSIFSHDSEQFTEAWFPLDTISYLPGLPFNPSAKMFRIADWAQLLNVNSHVVFDIGLSTTDEGGLIEDVSIAYRCWNPVTGEESHDCQLSIE
jgi:hypothetical protein